MKAKGLGFFSAGTLSCLIFMLISSLLPPSAFAFSGYGAGTSATPYRIGNCAQLGEINNNPSSHYILVSNIDCSSVTNFTSIGLVTAFSGTFDGQGHTIKGLSMNSLECGLFAQTNGATVENVNIQGGTLAYASHCNAGSIVGSALSSTLTNLHSSMAISASGGSGNDLGGIIGFLWGNSLSNSSFSGSIQNNFVFGTVEGGLIGAVQGAAVSDSYNTGTISESDLDFENSVGGLFGQQLTGTATSNVYSTGTINNVAGQSPEPETGGLIGYAGEGSVSNAFSASPENNAGLSGTIAGYNTGLVTFSGIYYDRTVTTFGSCAGFGSIACTVENISGSNPSYFFNNSTNGPFSNWDFSTTWQTTSSYPILQDLADFKALSGLPNNGDSTGDGTLDSYQANIGDILGADNIWSTVKVPSSTLCTVGNMQTTNNNSVSHYSNYELASDLTDFDLYCPTTGMTVSVTMYFNHVFNTNGALLLFYNPTSQKYTPVTNAVFSTANVGGNSETTVTYSITDGGQYDLSNIANGVIEDPVVVAMPPTATITSSDAPSTGAGQPNTLNSVAYIVGALGVSMLIFGIYLSTVTIKDR